MYIEASVAPNCRSVRNNLYSGIPHVLSGLDLYLLPVQYFPLLPVQCFPLLPVQCFPLLPVRSCDSDPRFRSPIPIPVSGPHSVSRFGFRFFSRSVSRFVFRSVSRSVSRFGFRSGSRSVSHIGFCSTILDSRPTPIPVTVPDSVSVSPSSRQRLPLLLALLPRGVALYRKQRSITDSHSARPRPVRSFGSRPRPITRPYSLKRRNSSKHKERDWRPKKEPLEAQAVPHHILLEDGQNRTQATQETTTTTTMAAPSRVEEAAH